MPATSDNIDERVVVSDDYQDEKIHVDFYSNSCIRIYRADPDADCPDDDGQMRGKSVWLDNLEKRELLRVLKEVLRG
jgi:hypothetical protein